MEFRLGDIVIVNDKSSYDRVIGKVGTIMDLKSEQGYIGIRVKGFNGHSLGGIINTDDGFWVEDYALELYKKSNKNMY